MDLTLKELMNFVKEHVDGEEFMIVVSTNDAIITLKISFPDYDVSASETIFEPELSKEEVYQSLLASLENCKSILQSAKCN